MLKNSYDNANWWEIDKEEYHRVYEAETLKGTPRQQAINIANEAARKKYEERPPFKKPTDWLKWEPEKAIREIQRGPIELPKIALSYVRRPGEAIQAGIRAAIEKEPVIPAMKRGLVAEEETKGRDILKAAKLPIDDPEWLLDHPVQHFLLELGGAGLELATDPVFWGMWFTPATKLLKGAQRYLARKEMTRFAKQLAKDMRGIAAPGARKVLLSELAQSPRYNKYITKPWYNELARHFGGTEYEAFFSLPARVTPQAIEALPKFSVLIAKAGGIIPRPGTEPYIGYWEGLSPSEQKLELERKKAVRRQEVRIEREAPPERPELTLAIRDIKTGKIHRATAEEKIHPDMMPRLGLRPENIELGWVDPKGNFYLEGRRGLATFEPIEAKAAPVETFPEELKIKHNTDIEEHVLYTGTPPSSLQQRLYIFNQLGKVPTSPRDIIKSFENLLRKNNLTAFKALSSGTPQITQDELSLKITGLDEQVAKINESAELEFESVRDYLFTERYPGEPESIIARIKERGGIKLTQAAKDYGNWEQYPLAVKNKEGLALDEMASELGIETGELNEVLAEYKRMPTKADFDELAYETLERNLEDFPTYAQRMKLLEQRDRYQSAMLELRAKTPPPKGTVEGIMVDQKEVRIEPEPKLAEEKITPIETRPEIDERIARVMEREMEKVKRTEEMELKFVDVIGDKPVEAPAGMTAPKLTEQLFLNVIPPEDIPTDIEPWAEQTKDVGALGWFRRVDYLFSDYQRATGVPIYSEGFKPIRDAAQMMRQQEMVFRGTLAQILRGIPEDRRIAIGKVMEGKKVKLSEGEEHTAKQMRNLYNFLAKEFNIPPEIFLKDYLPRIYKFFRTGDPTHLPKEMQAWFKRQRVGELKKRLEDPLDITRQYIHAGLRDKYLYDSKLIPEFVKHIENLPLGIKGKAEFWLTHKILRHPTRVDMNIALSIDNIPGAKEKLDKWGVDSTTALRQVTRGLSQVFYAGGIGFRVVSAGKNLTQQTHNIAILGLKYWIRGLLAAPKEEEKEVVEALGILRRYGAELERRGIDNPSSIPQKVADAGNFLFRKVDSLSRRVCLAGTREMVSDNYVLLHQGKINKQEFLKKTKFDLLPFGRRPEAIELFNDGDVEGYANVLGEEFVKLGQYTYEPESMPLIFSGATGRLASVFMSWPIEFAEMQAHFVKTGHWESILYYYLAASAVQNGLRYAGIETNPYGYGDVQVGNHRISLIPGGWFLAGSTPTGLSPALQIMYSGGRAVAVYGKGASDRYLNQVKQEFLRSTNIIAPFGLAVKDIIQAIEEIQSGTYGKRDKNGRLIYISDEAEVILRGLGFTTPTEAEDRYREPILELGEVTKLSKKVKKKEEKYWWR